VNKLNRLQRLKDEAMKGARNVWWGEQASRYGEPWFMTLDCQEVLFLVNELEYQTGEAVKARDDYSSRNAQCLLLAVEVQRLKEGMQALLDKK
jgi:hypothetical protein